MRADSFRLLVCLYLGPFPKSGSRIHVQHWSIVMLLGLPTLCRILKRWSQLLLLETAPEPRGRRR